MTESILEKINLITLPVRFFFILLDRILGVLRNVSLLIVTRVALKCLNLKYKTAKKYHFRLVIIFRSIILIFLVFDEIQIQERFRLQNGGFQVELKIACFNYNKTFYRKVFSSFFKFIRRQIQFQILSFELKDYRILRIRIGGFCLGSSHFHGRNASLRRFLDAHQNRQNLGVLDQVLKTHYKS